MKTNKERLDEWYAKLHGLWLPDWVDMPKDEFAELLARPRRTTYAHKKRSKQKVA